MPLRPKPSAAKFDLSRIVHPDGGEQINVLRLVADVVQWTVKTNARIA
jgi:hypothetical protein